MEFLIELGSKIIVPKFGKLLRSVDVCSPIQARVVTLKVFSKIFGEFERKLDLCPPIESDGKLKQKDSPLTKVRENIVE